jgi:uncharacterized protein (DUF885 family)
MNEDFDGDRIWSTAAHEAMPGHFLQLETLLADYMLKMGERASLRDFHDRLLSYGSIPLSVLGPELLADLDKPASAVRAAANY